MPKKRKPDATRLDEVDRTMHTTFCSAANSLSQLYTQAMHQQKLSFQAGERHGLDKLYNWILRQHENGSRVTTGDITTYLQNEIDYGAEESPLSQRLPFQHSLSQTATHLANSGVPVSSNSFGPATAVQGQGLRSGHSDHQAKNSTVFSNALSSPVRRTLQHYHMAQGGGYYPNNATNGNEHRNNSENSSSHHHHNRDSSNTHDSSMDMHADESPY